MKSQRNLNKGAVEGIETSHHQKIRIILQLGDLAKIERKSMVIIINPVKTFIRLAMKLFKVGKIRHRHSSIKITLIKQPRI